MSNLTANEYFNDFYKSRSNEYSKLLRVVRIDSPDSYYKKKGQGESKYTVISLVAIYRIEKKKFTIGHYTIFSYEDDNETIKKDPDTNLYLKWELIVNDSNYNKKELDAFELDSEKQLNQINNYIKSTVDDYSGKWSIIQDPWDPTAPVDFTPNNPRDTSYDDNIKKTEPVPETPIEPVVAPPVVLPPIRLQSDFNFDVKKESTFIITSGNNGNLVSLPDGTIVDIGELTIVKKEDPNDVEIIRILTPYSEQILELDSEYTDEEFAGSEEELVFIDSTGVIDTEYLNSIKGYDAVSPDENRISADNDYSFPVSKDIEKNIKIIIQDAKAAGITNGYTIAAMLACCKKECGLVPHNEDTYAGTKSSNIKRLFSSMQKYTDDEVNKIKKDAKKFFNIIYAYQGGNKKDEGYLFRGRGFNQLTFRGNYELYKKRTGYDIVTDPTSVNKIEVASKVLAEYMKYNFDKAKSHIKDKYKFTDINSFKSIDDAMGAVYHANAGFGKSFKEIENDSTGGRALAFKYVQQFYDDYLGKNRKK
jgi:predicted chitinase